jgi:nucleolar protein 15
MKDKKAGAAAIKKGSAKKRKAAEKKPEAASTVEEVPEDKIPLNEKVEEEPEESSDDSDDGEEVADDTKKVVPEKRKTKANRLAEMAEKAEEELSEPRGVVYLGHLPKGFYEPQMKTFFSQFGTVSRIRLSRSKKNAASKGYAFIEFEEESVAKIVAETMNKYLLFEKQLVCHLIPREKQHSAMFKQWKRGMKNWSNQRRDKARGSYNDRPKVDVDGEDVPQATLRQAARRNSKEKKLNSLLEGLGIQFNVAEASNGQRVKTKQKRKSAEQERPKLPPVLSMGSNVIDSAPAPAASPKKRKLDSNPLGKAGSKAGRSKK